MATLGAKVKARRVKSGLSQAELAERVGMTRSALAQLETDRVRQPRPAVLRRLSDELGLDYRELLGLTNQLSEVDDAPVATSETAALVAALDRQTAAISELVAALRDDRERLSPEAVRTFLSQLVAEGLIARPETMPSIGAPQQQGVGQ